MPPVPRLAIVPALIAAALLALAGPPAAGADAPRIGRWVGQGPHRLRVSFTVHPGPDGRRHLGQLVTICGAEMTGSEGGEILGSASPAWPIDRAGRAFEDDPVTTRRTVIARLGAERGTLERYSLSAGEGSPCLDGLEGTRGLGPVDVRWVGPQRVPSGRWHLEGDSGSHAPSSVDLTVYGGALVAEVSGSMNAPLARPRPYFQHCSVSGLFLDGWIEPDGSFTTQSTLTGDRVTGRFDGETVSGTLTVRSSGPLACATDTVPVAGRLVTPQVPPTSGGVRLGPATGGDAPPPDAGACPAPQTVTVDPVEAMSCFRDRRGLKVSTTTVRVNGIDVVPARGSEVRLDPRTARLTTTGRAAVRLPIGPYGTRRGVRVWRGERLDWALRAVRPFKIRSTGGDTGPGSQPGFGEQVIGGLPLTGTAELAFEPGSARGKVGVEMPRRPFKGYVGDVAVKTTNPRGLILDEVKVTIPRASSKRLGVDLNAATLALSRAKDGAFHWDGTATVELQGDRGKDLALDHKTLELTVEVGYGPGDGYFRLAGGLDGLNRPIYRGVHLQRIGLGAQVRPLKLTGSIGFSVGPQIDVHGQGKREAVSLDGTFEYEGEPPCFQTKVAGKIMSVELADGRAKLCANGLMEGEFRARTSPIRQIALEGRLAGWVVQDKAFSFEGTAGLQLGPLPAARADAVVSSVGMAACLRTGPAVGFSYRWRDRRPMLLASGCGIGPWRAAKPEAAARRAQAGPPAATFAVRRGQRVAAFSAVGDGAAPQVALVGPRGERIAVGPDPRLDERVLAFQDPDAHVSYVAVARPAPGRWRLEAQPGSAPVTALRGASPRARVRVRARVVRAGAGRARGLRYRIAGAAGARVRFVESGRGVRRVLGRATGRRGTLRFRPAPGRGARRIVALVERDGAPEPARRVARFRA